MSKYMIDVRGAPPKGQKEPNPWVLKQAEREEHDLPRSLLPGEGASVSIARGLLAQMVQAQTANNVARSTSAGLKSGVSAAWSG
jgi:hypothetical protein